MGQDIPHHEHPLIKIDSFNFKPESDKKLIIDIKSLKMICSAGI